MATDMMGHRGFSSLAAGCCAAAVSACTPLPRASVADDEPFVLVVREEHEQRTAHTVSTDSIRGFARLSMETGFATLEAWRFERETLLRTRSGRSNAHSHRTAIAWTGGDAMSEEGALVVDFSEALARCRDLDEDGSASEEKDCGFRSGRFAIVCRPSAVLVDDSLPPDGRAIHPSPALRCLLDGDAPGVLRQMTLDGALWFPLEPGVRLSKVDGGHGETLRFETALDGWMAERGLAAP